MPVFMYRKEQRYEGVRTTLFMDKIFQPRNVHKQSPPPWPACGRTPSRCCRSRSPAELSEARKQNNLRLKLAEETQVELAQCHLQREKEFKAEEAEALGSPWQLQQRSE